MLKVGIIGLGTRSSHMLSQMLGYDAGVELAAVADPDREKAERLLVEKGLRPREVALYPGADEMLDGEALDGLIIGTRCSLHTAMAVKVLRKEIPLFLEKPVSTNLDDLALLKAEAEKSKSPVVVSFPLRVTALAKLAREIIDSGRIGTVEQVQAVNNVPYGGVYFHSWYRDDAETGGLFIQKATHDFDYINYLLDVKPVEVCAMTSKTVYKGSKPAGLFCKDCAEYRTCPESPFVLEHFKSETVQGPMCCFAVDTGNEDSGSALVRYENGTHVCYTQNFIARKDAASRGARLIGYSGTLEFDWFTDELKVFLHTTLRTETYKLDSSKMSHGGGDAALAWNFIEVMKGREPSAAPLETGLLSTLMCLKAKESAETGRFVGIEW